MIQAVFQSENVDSVHGQHPRCFSVLRQQGVGLSGGDIGFAGYLQNAVVSGCFSRVLGFRV